MAWTERYVDASASGGGTGTSTSDPWTLVEAWNNSTGGMKVNIKAGNYTISSNLDRNLGGTDSSPIWWSGYKTTPGDSDEIFSTQKAEITDIPKVTLSSGYYWVERGGRWHVSSMSFVSNSNSRPALWPLGLNNRIWNCRCVNNAVNTFALQCGGHSDIVNCYFEQNGSSSPNMVDLSYSNWFGCEFVSLVNNSSVATQSPFWGSIINCIFRNLQNGISIGGGCPSIIGNTFYNISQNAINITSSCNALIVNNYFSNITGSAVSSSSTLGTMHIAGNAYESVGTELTNVYEDFQTNSFNDSSDQFVGSGNNNFTLKSTSNGYAAGLPIMFQESAVKSYSDIGAIQHANPSLGVVLNAKHPIG